MRILATTLAIGFTLKVAAQAQADPSYYDYSYSAKADYTYTKNPVQPEPLTVPCFTAGEFHLDAISLYADVQGDSLEDGAGGGIGASYFFTEMFGVMGRAYWWDTDSVITSITASAVLRAPIQSVCLAPYVYGGLGGHFNSENQIGGHLGAGLEFRMTERLGIFSDFTYTWADKTDDWGMYTLGLRLAF